VSRSPVRCTSPVEGETDRFAAAPIPSSPEAVHSDREETRIRQIRDRAENLFRTRQYHCAEAILVAMNRGFRGGLSEPQAVALASGLTHGLGGSGCTCGAVSGAILALGLLVGGDHPHRNRSRVRRASAALHERFKTAHGSTCCRVLTRKGEKAGRARFDRCGAFTGDGAEMAARLALEFRPELARTADPDAAEKRDSRLVGFLLRVGRLVR
jgi:C_GCAxxG_C_C family probable redox protein